MHLVAHRALFRLKLRLRVGVHYRLGCNPRAIRGESTLDFKEVGPLNLLNIADKRLYALLDERGNRIGMLRIDVAFERKSDLWSFHHKRSILRRGEELLKKRLDRRKRGVGINRSVLERHDRSITRRRILPCLHRRLLDVRRLDLREVGKLPGNL